MSPIVTMDILNVSTGTPFQCSLPPLNIAGFMVIFTVRK